MTDLTAFATELRTALKTLDTYIGRQPRYRSNSSKSDFARSDVSDAGEKSSRSRQSGHTATSSSTLPDYQAPIHPIYAEAQLNDAEQGTPWIGPLPDKSAYADIWRTYVTEADKYDEDLLKKWGDGIDVFLIFTGLFSAILSAFLVVAWANLQPDPTQTTSDALGAISMQLVLLSSGERLNSSTAYQTPDFVPSWSALVVNCLWFASLFISLLAAVLAMLVKEWLSSYKQDIALVPLDRVKQRQLRYDGLNRWNMPSIINLLPLSIHVAVFLFLTGLVVFAWPISIVLSKLMMALLAFGFGLYTASAILACTFEDCPYKSPLVSVLHIVYRTILHPMSTSLGRHVGMMARERRLLEAKNMILQAKAISWMTRSDNPTVQELGVYFSSRWSLPLRLWKTLQSEMSEGAARVIAHRLFQNEGMPVDDVDVEKLCMMAALVTKEQSLGGLVGPQHREQPIALERVLGRSLVLEPMWWNVPMDFSPRSDDWNAFDSTLHLEMERLAICTHSPGRDLRKILPPALTLLSSLMDKDNPPRWFVSKLVCLYGHAHQLARSQRCCVEHNDSDWIDRYSEESLDVQDLFAVVECLKHAWYSEAPSSQQLRYGLTKYLDRYLHFIIPDLDTTVQVLESLAPLLVPEAGMPNRGDIRSLAPILSQLLPRVRETANRRLFRWARNYEAQVRSRLGGIRGNQAVLWDFDDGWQHAPQWKGLPDLPESPYHV